MPEMCSVEMEKFEGIDIWEVRNAASTLKEAVDLGEKPELLEAAKKWLKEERMKSREAVGLADNL